MAFPSGPYPGQLHREGGQTWWCCPDPQSLGIDIDGAAWMPGFNHWREVEREDGSNDDSSD